MEIQALKTAISVITTIDQTSTLLCNAGLDRDSAIERKNYSRQLKLQKVPASVERDATFSRLLLILILKKVIKIFAIVSTTTTWRIGYTKTNKIPF